MKPSLLAMSLAAGIAVAVAPWIGAQAETVGPVTDEIGVVKIPKGAPIQIGGYWALSGPDIAAGLDEKRAVEVAFAERSNEVAGHPIRLIAEDSQCTAEGGQTAATKLASNEKIVLVLGPDCSSSATPGAPILWQAGIPSIGISTSAPALTAPDRKPGYHGFLRTVYNDLDQGRGDAKWMHDELGCETAATIHDGSPYAEQLVRVMEETFKKLGGKITSSSAVAPVDVDMKPLLTRIATDKPCVIYYPVFVAAAAQITRQTKQISGLEETHLIGGVPLLAPSFIEATGSAVVGFRVTSSDHSPEAFGAGYPKLVEMYKKMFGEAPIQGFHANAYDAATIALMAIEKVAKKDDDGNTYIGRKALRDALFATKGVDGVAGPINCSENGDCASFKFAVYEFTDDDPSTFKIGVNPKKVYP